MCSKKALYEMFSRILKTVSRNDETSASATLENSEGVALLSVSGDWLFKNQRTQLSAITNALDSAKVKKLEFDCEKLGEFDSSFISFLFGIYNFCLERNIECDISKISEKPRTFLLLAVSDCEREKEKDKKASCNFFVKVYHTTYSTYSGVRDQISFFGELVICSYNFIRRRAHFRFSDLGFEIQRAGPDALPIVGLISFLVGLILAFVGAIQLAKYGSEIYVADLVGLAMVREMGAVMVAIAMAGRTGAAYAAELGAMKINEEIAAFRTFGISPMEFLVFPRIIALVLMFPLLTVFADFIGMLGGFAISWSLFDINYDAYINRTLASLNLTHCMTGVFKSVFFGIIVAIVGSMKGMTCGKNAEAVGNAATSSVVTSITLIIVADAIFAVIFTVFNI